MLESSCVLACNHGSLLYYYFNLYANYFIVFDIIVKKFNGEDWKKCFIDSIPNRKIISIIEDGEKVYTEQYIKK